MQRGRTDAQQSLRRSGLFPEDFVLKIAILWGLEFYIL